MKNLAASSVSLLAKWWWRFLARRVLYGMVCLLAGMGTWTGLGSAKPNLEGTTDFLVWWSIELVMDRTSPSRRTISLESPI